MKPIKLFVILLSAIMMFGCNEDKCIFIVDESNQSVDPVRVYLLDSNEYNLEITNKNNEMLGDGKGTQIGKSQNGKVCFSNKNESIFGGYYKVVAPKAIYKNNVHYYSSFKVIPKKIVLKMHD